MVPSRCPILAVGAKCDGIDQTKRFGKDAVNNLGLGKVGLGQPGAAQVKLPEVEVRKIIPAQVHIQL
jgi:hypothetical protein